jgi:hypothetical protein
MTRHRDEFIARMPEAERKQISAAYSSGYEADQEPKGFVPDGHRYRLSNGAVLFVTGEDSKAFDAVMAYSDVVDAEVRKQRWVTVRFLVLLALAPCVALYAVGWSAGWVYRGFRPRLPSSEE